MLKGRNNFLCLDWLRESEARGELAGLYDDEQSRQADAIVAWARSTKTGDVSELLFVPLPQVWPLASVGSDECKDDDCPFREECFAERAKAIAREADIVVTNYHMLFAHLDVRRETGQDLVLPPFDLLVCDEAHEAAEIARDFFGFSVSEHAVTRLARAAGDLGDKKLADSLRQHARELFDRIAAFARSPAYRKRLERPGFVATAALARELLALASRADALAGDETRAREVRAAARNAARLARTAAGRIDEAVQQSDPGKVYWIEAGVGKLGSIGVRVLERAAQASLPEGDEGLVDMAAGRPAGRCSRPARQAASRSRARSLASAPPAQSIL